MSLRSTAPQSAAVAALPASRLPASSAATSASRAATVSVARLAALVFVSGALALLVSTGCNDPHLERDLKKIASAAGTQPSRPNYRGVRVVEFHAGSTQGTHKQRTHKERIADLGGDDLGAQLLEVDGAAATDAEQLLFVKDARQWLRYRDLALDDVSRVLRNYSAERVPGSDAVAGRPTFHLRFQHKNGSAAAGISTIDLLADEETGLALQVSRASAGGQLLYRMSYESIEIGKLERNANDPKRLPAAPKRAPAGPAPFTALASSGLPQGFERADHFFGEVPVDGVVHRACVDRYSDGLEHLFVVQSAPGESLWVEGPPQQAAGGSTEGELTFYSANVGAITIVWGEANGRTLAAYGPFADEVLGDLVASYR